MKIRTSILIEKDVLTKAQQLGINVSKACENCLKIYIEALKNANQKIVPEKE